MPPKKLKHDWSWVENVRSANEITDQHRLAAAGLTDIAPCTFAFPVSDGDTIPAKDKRCASKCCGTNPACYNHIGTKELLDPKGKEKYVESKLSKRAEKRKEGVPAGLRNLGATCYANAFLQLWFHNIPFRNAIYACAPIANTPLFHLAHIFASLQHTEKQFIDPMSLIEALRLNKGEQQDAAEFSKLFLEMITNELLKQNDLKLRSLTRDLFEGTLRYTTRCDCGYASQRDTSFLELELSLKEGTSLMDRLDYSLSDERLEGDNQYHCQSCGIKRDATRSATITRLPPILHFSLLRFVFDSKTYERKKSRASITFPRQLVLGGHEYRLQAIITHSGPSAHEGHFVCEAEDQETGSWFMCDDEDVTRINRNKLSSQGEARQAIGLTSEPPTKRAKTDENTLKSKDAYMLVYTRLGHVDPIPAPTDIMQQVELELAEWEHEQGRQELERRVLEDEYQGLVGAKKRVARVLLGMDCLIPSAQLERWFKAEKLGDLFRPWDIPVCPHGDVDPDSTGLFKVVSAEAFEILRGYGFDLPDEYAAERDLERKRSRVDTIDLSQSPPSTADKIPSNPSGPEKQAVTMDVEDETRRMIKAGSKGIGASERNGSKRADGMDAMDRNNVGDTSSTRSPSSHDAANPPHRNGSSNAITSSSNLRTASTDMSRTPSSQSGIQTFSILPRVTICPICIEAEYHTRTAPGLSKKDKEFWRTETKLDRLIMKFLDPKFVMFDTDYYYLPDTFVEQWQGYVRHESAPRPKLASDLGRCEHGLLAVDLEMDEIHFMDTNGWNQVVKRYGDAKPVTFRFPKAKSDIGKRSPKTHVSVETCESCRHNRLSDFDETQIYLKLERTSIPTSRRTKNKEVSLDVKKTTKVVDIKVEILRQTHIMPINITLYHNGRELNNQETVASIGILSGDQVVGKEMEVIEIKDEPVIAERGFGGTALHGRSACPDCTFENQPEAACCEMCQRPFGYDQ